MGVGAAIASFAGSLGFSTAASAAISTAVINTGTSVLIGTAFRALTGSRGSAPKAQDIARELSRPSSLPSYRHVYGKTRATGTPWATPVRGDFIWGVWLLNSRPSELRNVKLFLDKREVRFWNPEDLFDFSSGGAEGRNDKFDKHVEAWISRGDQTRPPDEFLERVPYGPDEDEELFKETDRFKGLTTIWLKIKAGEDEERQERWPNAPPVVEVEGEWSRVWNPLDPSQDPDDPDTWEFSENHALCSLDALRNNPMRQYRIENLHLDSFKMGVQASDEPVLRRDGTTEARYRAAGTVLYKDNELEDVLNPLMVSAAADFVRIGGRLGYIPAVYREPTTTLETLVGDSFEFSDMLPGNELVNELRVSYLSKQRGYQTAELRPWKIPGALDEDRGIPAPKDLELSLCPSETQAMRVRKITGLRMRRQERLKGVNMPPRMFNLVAGSTANVRFPSPYDQLDGEYAIEQIHPALDPLGDNGVALRMPAVLVTTGPDVYAWNKAEEEDIISIYYSPTQRGVQSPGPLSAEPDNLDTGDTVLPRLRISFFPSDSAGVIRYSMQVREHDPALGEDEAWGARLDIDPKTTDADGRVYGLTEPLSSSKTYDIRVRTVASAGVSSYRTLTDIPTDGLLVALTPPLPVEPFDTSVSNEIEAAFRTRNEPDTRGVEIFASDVDDFSLSVQLGDEIFAGPNALVSITETGIPTGTTRYYFARSLGPYGSVSEISDSVAATAT